MTRIFALYRVPFQQEYLFTKVRVKDTRTMNGGGGGGVWDFRICGFRYFLGRFFGFCAKRLRVFGFCAHCGKRSFRLLAFGSRFS